MAWLQVHQSLPAHRKTLRCADLLSIPEAHVVGHLVILWLWALDNTIDGRLPGVTPRMIERVTRWEGEPKAFTQALVDAGFLNEEADAYAIHDWDDYAGKLLDQRASNRERQRRYRERQRREANGPHAGDARVTSPLRNGAKEEERKEEKKRNTSARTQVDYSPEFEAFWSHYPRKVEKRRAFRIWQARIREGASPTDLEAAAQNYAAQCRREKTESRYIKHAATFLSADEPYAEYLPGASQQDRPAVDAPEPGSGLAAVLRSARELGDQREQEASNPDDTP